ncbi:MAG TPA: hypothetical protein VHE33_16890 [Acidobacteriaceae bacterium]|nr:hypothetical protein [Acidobacteriaceae bacterium]
MPQRALILAVCALLCGTAWAAQVPSFRRPPMPEFQRATFLGASPCKPDPYYANCEHRGDPLYTIVLDGRTFVLHPGFSLPLLTMAHLLLTPWNRSSLSLPGDNVLDHLPPGTMVQIRMRDGGMDVRVLAQSSKGPRYLASHYGFAKSQDEANSGDGPSS